MSEPLQPFPVVKQGAEGHPVPTLQYLLNDHLDEKATKLAVDGIFGPKTEQAVRDFQTAHKLTVDGIVGPQTWGAVIVTVQRGSTGDAVRAVQAEINFRDLKDGHALDVDGIFGPRTETAVRAFQRAVEIVVDGIVGPVTWQALISGMLAG